LNSRPASAEGKINRPLPQAVLTQTDPAAKNRSGRDRLAPDGT
jgi:hypothetical protein